MFIANVTRVQRVPSYQDINLIIDYAWLQIVIMFFQFTNSAREHGYLVFPRRAARCSSLTTQTASFSESEDSALNTALGSTCIFTTLACTTP